MSKLKFFIEGIRNFKEVGTVTRSSPALAKKMVSFINNSEDVIIIELGAGDGVLTHYILNKMSENSKLISIELNENLFKTLDRIKDDRFVAVNGNVNDLPEILKLHGVSEIDIVISAIPFIVFPKKQAEEILKTCKDTMKMEALYVQVHYAKNLRKIYQKIFGNLKMYFVPLNIPPAYAFVCKKEH